MKWLILLGLVALAIGAGVAWILSHEPPRQLDIVNNLFPGDSNAELVERGVTFDAESDLKLNIWRPASTKDRNLPVLVFFYGGGWYSGDRDHYDFAGRAYAARGYVTVLPNYRYHPEVHFPTFMEDAAKAVAWVHDNIAEYGGDADRIVLAGHSAGAYNVLMLGLDRQWLGREGKKVSDVVKGVASLAGPTDFHPFEPGGRADDVMGRVEKPELTQPINFVRADSPPLWLAHGTADKVVRVRNSRVLAKAMDAVGGQAELREYENNSHNDLIMAIAKPFRSRIPVLDESIAFFDSVGAGPSSK